MSNFRMLSHSVSDAGVFSGGNWATTLPRTNLFDNHPKKVARTTNALVASTQFLVELGSALPLQDFAFINNNFSDLATYRVRAGPNANGVAPLIDTGSVDALAIGSANVPPGGWITYYHNATVQSCRYILVEITDTANASGYVQIGRFMAGVPYEAAINISIGVTLELMDTSSESRAVAGDRFVDIRPKRRSIKAILEWLSEAEALGPSSIYDILEGGISSPILAMFDSGDTDTVRSRRTLYGALAMPPAPIAYSRTAEVPYSWPFTIDEWT
jgi:hypothetical protein